VPQAEVRLVKELGVSHREFFRLLPRALADAPYALEAGRVVTGQGPRRLEILLAPEAERRLSASVRFPVTRIELVFRGYAAAERAAFLLRFERAFQKGGG
jgi:hypothetical protein